MALSAMGSPCSAASAIAFDVSLAGGMSLSGLSALISLIIRDTVFTSPVAEDEKDVTKVVLREEIFESLAKGYLSELSAFLTKPEKQYLLMGAKYMILIIGLRFLTDYLQNDVYFKTKYADHNLVRARNQFALLRNLVDNEARLNSIISKHI